MSYKLASRGVSGFGQVTTDGLVADPWTQRKAAQFQAAIARAGGTSGLGQDPTLPPPKLPMNWIAVVGWGAVVAVTAGLFFATTSGTGMKPRHVRANSKRRTTRRNGTVARHEAAQRAKRTWQMALHEYDSQKHRANAQTRDWLLDQVVLARKKYDQALLGGRVRGGLARNRTVVTPGQIAAIKDRLFHARTPEEAKAAVQSARFLIDDLREYAPGSPEQKTLMQSMARALLVKNRLSDARRAKLPKKVFVFPDRRAWPLDTPERAYSAIQMLKLGRVSSASDYHRITQAIRYRFPHVWNIYGKKLAWSKVKRAKGRARTSRRRTTRRGTKKIAANSSWMRQVKDLIRKAEDQGWRVEQATSGHWKFFAPTGNDVIVVAGTASDWRAMRNVLSRMRRSGFKENARRSSKPKFSEWTVYNAVGTVREAHPKAQLHILPPEALRALRQAGPGIFSIGYGKNGFAMRKFSKAGMLGAVTSTRIGASRSREPHWVVDNYDPSYPVVIRGIDKSGHTVHRVEEYAQQFERELVPVRRTEARYATR